MPNMIILEDLRHDFFVGHIKWLLIFEWHLVGAKYTQMTLKSTDLNLCIYVYILAFYVASQSIRQYIFNVYDGPSEMYPTSIKTIL